MTKFSIVLEGDKPHETCEAVAKTMDGKNFYSLQFYEHLPYRPAWGLACSIAPYVRKIRLGPVTVPANLYSPAANARFLAYLDTFAAGSVMGISRGAYMGERRASAGDVIEAVRKTVEERRKIPWAKPSGPVIYVGTSGPRLTRAASTLPEVSGIVVDNLANPTYVAEMRRMMNEAGGREKELVARPFTFISEDPAEIEWFFWELRRYVVDLVDGSPMMEAAGLTPEDLLNVDEEVKTKVLENFAVCGPIDEVLEKAAKLIKAGASHICFGHPLASDPVAAVKIIAEKIIQQLDNGPHG